MCIRGWIESSVLQLSDDDDSEKSLRMRSKLFPMLPDLVLSIFNGVNKSHKPYLRLDVANYVTSDNFGGEFGFYWFHNSVINFFY